MEEDIYSCERRAPVNLQDNIKGSCWPTAAGELSVVEKYWTMLYPVLLSLRQTDGQKSDHDTLLFHSIENMQEWNWKGNNYGILHV